MRQRRISGIGGLSLEGVSFSRDADRVFWVMKNMQYLTLFTKIYKYASASSEDPLDFTSGQKYYLGAGQYRGMTHVRNELSPSTEIWTTVYSIDNVIYRVRFDVAQKQLIEKVPLNMTGYGPEIFYKGSNYYLSFYNNDQLYISQTLDFISFNPVKKAIIYKQDFNNMIYIADSNINFTKYHQINSYIKQNLTSTNRY